MSSVEKLYASLMLDRTNMGLKENAMWFVGGAVIALGLPTLLTWANITSLSPPYSVAWDWSKFMIPGFGGQMMMPPAMMPPAMMMGDMMMPPAMMSGAAYAYAGRAGGRGGNVTRSVTITPRAGGRSVAGHTGNTIGYGGDLNAVPGWAATLLNPAWTGTVQRYVRS